ncbi:MAG: COX15/CtaA family protein [Proteobacteria bacterium]|nr:COX15/CtaA family protein [Pseudomonadota bacterium]
MNYHKLAKIALILAVFVIMLGAYTRLTDAGLGCPDWPGCYGHMVLPNSTPALTDAAQKFPNQPIVAHKAWTEMVHRYVAGALGLLIIILAVWSIIKHRSQKNLPLVAPLLLVGVLIFQAVLGMWTVTLKLLPLVVTGHLLGGMTIAALLSWVVSATRQNRNITLPDGGSQEGGERQRASASLLRPGLVRAQYKNQKTAVTVATAAGLIILIIQLFLGAWTSTNYAALACGSDFPTCAGSLWPSMNWSHGFNILSPIGPNYEGGVLDMVTRVTIQMAHRYWALITFIYLAPLALFLLTNQIYRSLHYLASALLILLVVQISLGILNVVKLLPLPIAVAHNGVAVLLLIILVALLARSREIG